MKDSQAKFDSMLNEQAKSCDLRKRVESLENRMAALEDVAWFIKYPWVALFFILILFLFTIYEIRTALFALMGWQ